MEIRGVDEEYEAKLVPAGGRGGAGKVERKRYRDGDDALRAKVRGFEGGSSTATLDVFVNGAQVGTLDESGKKAELQLDRRAMSSNCAATAKPWPVDYS